jgi:hypothetical protein
MDIALNHATGQCPLAALYWNSATNQPAANNPWFNVTATHPYNVFNDFNHESLSYPLFSQVVWWSIGLQNINWMVSAGIFLKGLPKTHSAVVVLPMKPVFAAYHADRVAIWKRYYDTMQGEISGQLLYTRAFLR